MVDAETAVLLGAVADDPTALSYLVASAALLTTEDRQALLAESATRRRLAMESRLLRRELTLLQTLGRGTGAAAAVRRPDDGQLTAAHGQGSAGGPGGGTSTSGRSSGQRGDLLGGRAGRPARSGRPVRPRSSPRAYSTATT